MNTHRPVRASVLARSQSMKAIDLIISVLFLICMVSDMSGYGRCVCPDQEHAKKMDELDETLRENLPDGAFDDE